MPATSDGVPKTGSWAMLRDALGVDLRQGSARTRIGAEARHAACYGV